MNSYSKMAIVSREVHRSGGKGRKKRSRWITAYKKIRVHLTGKKDTWASQRNLA